MRLRLPYVFELDCVHRGGRSVRAENHWAEIDVDIPEVGPLGDPVLQWGHQRLYAHDGKLFRSWVWAEPPDHAGFNAQQYIDAMRAGRTGGELAPRFPAPPYMRVRRMGYFDNALTLDCPKFDHVPYSARLVWKNGRDERAEEASRFYAQSLLVSGNLVFTLAEEPVLHVKRVRSPHADYAIVLNSRPDFRTAYREFRVDRLEAARTFINESLDSTFDDGTPELRINDAGALRRSDRNEVAACILEYTRQKDDTDEFIPGLFSGEPQDAVLGLAEAGPRLARAMRGVLGMNVKAQILSRRWEFEQAIWNAEREARQAALMEPEEPEGLTEEDIEALRLHLEGL